MVAVEELLNGHVEHGRIGKGERTSWWMLWCSIGNTVLCCVSRRHKRTNEPAALHHAQHGGFRSAKTRRSPM